MMRSGSLYELPTLARLTDESGSSSWPTATVKDNHNRKGLSPTSGDGLATAAGMWGTPTASQPGGTAEQHLERKRRALEKGASIGVSVTALSLQAGMWGTPTARDWKDGACADADVPTNGLLGRMAARWPTPRASNPKDMESPERWLARAERLAAEKTHGNAYGMPLPIAAVLCTNFLRSPPTSTDGEDT
jgi:DNA (cytosine-5)-methyltransferase 1